MAIRNEVTQIRRLNKHHSTFERWPRLFNQYPWVYVPKDLSVLSGSRRCGCDSVVVLLLTVWWSAAVSTEKGN
jgi:hypothetical protein